MILQNKVNQDYRRFIQTMNAVFSFRKYQMTKSIKDVQNNLQKIIAFHLSNMPTINYNNYLALHLDKTIPIELEREFKIAETRIKEEWTLLRKDANLMGRLFMAFVARKSQPPWIPVKINLETPHKERKGPNWSVSIPYYLKRYESIIMDQISIGVKNEESISEIVSRIKNVFGKRKSREAKRTIVKEQDDSEIWDQTAQVLSQPTTDVSVGVYTTDDVQALKDRQYEAMNWYHRDYSPDMAESVWMRNKAMMGLERDMMNDVLYAMNSGFITVGNENMGIKDYVWITSKPQKECDVCCDRDNLTMSQIKDKFGTGGFPKGEVYPYDLKQNDPPPLHPHCHCQLVAQINDDWSDNALEKNGYTWDATTGEAFNPTAEQRKLGFTKMSWDQWLGDLSR